MKRIIPIVLLMLLFFFSAFIVFVEAADEEWCSTIPAEKKTGGLVPCGRDCNDPITPEDETQPCELCHLFVMLDRIIKFLLGYIVPSLAALMIAIGGGMYIVSQGNPEMLGRAKKLFTSVVFGLLIIYGAWLIVNLFLTVIGVTVWQGPGQGWWIIPCD